ncbi:MAG: PKD domain-containing protein [Planctomycetota bacterium]
MGQTVRWSGDFAVAWHVGEGSTYNTYAWDFSDGSPVVDTGVIESVEHIYTAPGHFELRLIVTTLAVDFGGGAPIVIDERGLPMGAISITSGGERSVELRIQPASRLDGWMLAHETEPPPSLRPLIEAMTGGWRVSALAPFAGHWFAFVPAGISMK